MYHRLVLFLAVSGFATSLGDAQPSPDLSIPEPCRTISNEELPVLEKRKEAIEREIARANARSKAKGENIQLRQEDLLKVIVEIECARTRLKPQPRAAPETRGSSKQASKFVEITTYYATNRNPSDRLEPENVYGANIGGQLHYGRAVVSIPMSHSPGSIELPSLWRLERQPDPSRHFVLKSVVPLDTDAARREMAEKLQASSRNSLLVFVHGYYTGFREAAMRTAQLAHDLKFPGVPFFFSWPSAAQLLGYLQDAEAAQLSEAAFEQLLDELSQLPVSDIYVVAHSMGSRIVGQALKTRTDRGKQTPHLRELLLAAPDINVEVFRTIVAPKLAAMQGTRTTIYASSSDLALRLSKVMHGFKRVGETADTYPGLETIDASSAALVTRGYGHSYLMDSPSLLKDIQTIIQQKFSPKQRGLNEIGRSPKIFWRLQ
jgi:esterase/lipase superfamily enzyme